MAFSERAGVKAYIVTHSLQNSSEHGEAIDSASEEELVSI